MNRLWRMRYMKRMRRKKKNGCMTQEVGIMKKKMREKEGNIHLRTNVWM